MQFELTSPLIPCTPPFWAKTGHAQTILGHFLPSPKITERDESISILLPDGDTLVAHHFPGTSGTVVYLFHGLGGESHGTYMQRTALLARSLGHSVIMANHRGCGAGRGLARQPYHSGRAEDLSAVIAEGRKLYPRAVHLAIGFSLSANALLLLAAGHRGEVLPDAAIAVNAPINLGRASDLLLQGLNRVYDYNFMGDMREAVASRAAAGYPVPTLNLPWYSNLQDFDRVYTAPAGGFDSRQDYYEKCSAAQYLNRVRIPTIAITAEDDPFVSPIDYREAALSPFVHLHVEKYGGHMGYLSRDATPLGTTRWLDYALMTYMRALRV